MALETFHEYMKMLVRKYLRKQMAFVVIWYIRDVDKGTLRTIRDYYINSTNENASWSDDSYVGFIASILDDPQISKVSDASDNKDPVLWVHGIPTMNIRGSHNRPILTMVFPITQKTMLVLKLGTDYYWCRLRIFASQSGIVYDTANEECWKLIETWQK